MADRRSSLTEIYSGEGYSSEFGDQETERKKTWRDDGLSGIKRKTNTSYSLPSKRMVSSEYCREEARSQKNQFLALDAYSRHKKMVNDYVLYYGHGVEHFTRDSSRDKTDFDVIREEHRFVWNEGDNASDSWEKQLAKKYYDKLFKEYCISDLSRYRENKVALRWRIEKEVFEGKGQFSCGDKNCTETEGLRSWEVNFAYVEHGEKKNTLVKLRLCPNCSYKLNYHHKRKLVKKETNKKETERGKSRSKKQKKRKKKRHGKKDASSSDSADDLSEDSSNDSSELDRSREAGRSMDYSRPSSSVEDIWKGPVKIAVEKTREEEFEEYFQDMFL